MASEAWVRGANAFGVMHGSVAGFGQKTGDEKGHGDAVVAVTLELRAFKSLATEDFHAVLEFLNLRTHEPEIFRHSGDAVGFFHPQFTGVANAHATLRQGTGDG